jgi:hypothetical protein
LSPVFNVDNILPLVEDFLLVHVWPLSVDILIVLNTVLPVHFHPIVLLSDEDVMVRYSASGEYSVIVNVHTAFLAEYVSSPANDAVNVHVPSLTNVTLPLLSIVATSVSDDEYVTDRPYGLANIGLILSLIGNE